MPFENKVLRRIFGLNKYKQKELLYISKSFILHMFCLMPLGDLMKMILTYNVAWRNEAYNILVPKPYYKRPPGRYRDTYMGR